MLQKSEKSSVIENLRKSGWQLMMGVEVHAQLNSRKKLFSQSSNTPLSSPNENVTYWEFGYPGILPIVNKEPVEKAIKTGIALNGQINTMSFFDRKHYFYPDSPQSYQITQFYKPIMENGYIIVNHDGENKKIRIKQMHMEADAGKNIHMSNFSLLDFNRVGVGLVEIVTMPDMTSINDVTSFVEELIKILKYIDTCDCNMEKGCLRVDVNISLHNDKLNKHSDRCEVKNLNSLRAIRRAIEVEATRQVNIMEKGEQVISCTLLFDQDLEETKIMRSKESVADYMYIRDNDIPPLFLTEEHLVKVKESITMLPSQAIELLQDKYGLNNEEASVMSNTIELFNYFIKSLDGIENNNTIKKIYNIIVGDLSALSNDNKINIWESLVKPEYLGLLVQQLEEKVISHTILKQVLEKVWETGKNPIEIIEQSGLKQITDENIIRPIIIEILEKNQESVKQYKAGKEQLFKFFVGQVMGKTSGKADSIIVQNILIEELKK